MKTEPSTLVRDLALRVHTVADIPVSGRVPRAPAYVVKVPVGHRLLCVTMDDEERGARPFTIGLFRVCARDGTGAYGEALPTRLTEPIEGVIVSEALPQQDRARVRAWARPYGLRVLDVQTFVHEVLFREMFFEGTLGATWDWGVLLGSLATHWAQSSDEKDAFTFTLCPLYTVRHTAHRHGPTRHPWCPRVRVRRLTEPSIQTVEFTCAERKPRWRGRFLGLHEKASMLSGQSQTLASACRMLGAVSPSDSASSSIEDRLDALRSRLDAVCAFAERAQAALLDHRAIVSDEHERARLRHSVPRVSVCDVHTPAALGQRYLLAMGLSTPPRITTAPDLGLSVNDVLGASMAAFFPGHAQLYARRVPVLGVLADLGRQYPTVASNLHHWDWWTADHVEARDETDMMRALLAHARPEDYLRRDAWAVLNVLVLVQPRGEWLPTRVDMDEDTQTDEMILTGPLTVPDRLGPIWMALPDVLRSVWKTGRVPEVLHAIRFVPVGQRSNLRPVTFGASGTLDPRHDLFVQLVEARGRFQTSGAVHLAQAAKVTVNGLAFGKTAELHSERVRDVTLFDGVRRRSLRTRYERPGRYYCPPLAALMTAAARLQLFLLEYLVQKAGHRCAMVAVDSAFLTGPDPLTVYAQVRDRLETLNTVPTMRPLLKLDAAHGTPPRPLTFYGVAVSRYCVYEDRSPQHLPPRVVKSSGQVLGSVLDPITHAKSRLGAGTPAWWGAAWRWAKAHAAAGQSRGPIWLSDPAPYVAFLTTPAQVRQYAQIHGGARPFQQVLVLPVETLGKFAPRPVAPLHLCTPTTSLFELPWKDRSTGRLFTRIRDEAGTGVLPLQTYESLLIDHIRHPDVKDPDPLRRGWSTRTFSVAATGVRHRRKESVLPVDADDSGFLFAGDEERDYVGVDAGEVQAACDTLRPFTSTCLAVLADLLGVTPHPLRDVLSGRAAPRAGLAARLVALADQVRRMDGVLPSRLDLALDGGDHRTATHEALRALRTRGVSARMIARACRVSPRTVWAWQTGATPRGRAFDRLVRAAREGHHETGHEEAVGG